MKQVVIFMITVILLVSCNKKSEVEIIPNEYRNYYRSDEVNRLPAFEDTNYASKVNEEFIKIVKSVLPKDKKQIVVPFHYDIYISKEGDVEKIKNIEKVDNFNNRAATGTSENKYLNYESFKELEKLDSKFAKLVADWKFIPALKNGSPVQYIIDFNSFVMIHEDGRYIFGYKTYSSHFLFRNYLYQNYHIDVEDMPEPIGGIAAIAENVKYPQAAKLAGIQGRVFVKAFINERGGVDRVEVIKGIGSGCDEAAMDAVKRAKFKPGRQRGKPVNVQITVPILFKLQ